MAHQGLRWLVSFQARFAAFLGSSCLPTIDEIAMAREIMRQEAEGFRCGVSAWSGSRSAAEFEARHGMLGVRTNSDGFSCRDVGGNSGRNGM
jgi:hypothetical protein